MNADVVFVRGVMGRSGTNFLADLLLLHPDCAQARAPVWEDFLVDEAEKLISYVSAVAGHWPTRWDPSSAVRESMLKSIGDGLQLFLRGNTAAATVVAKTPSVVGIENFFAIFPEAPLVLLVRDGRAVTDSAMRSFGWSFERAAHEWRDGAERIVAFDGRWRTTHRSRYLIIRYEDLIRDLRATLIPLLEFCSLDSARFDYDAAEGLPVRGSSVLGTIEIQGKARPQWRKPVSRDPSFDPTQRWQQWDASRRARFQWIAGDYLEAFGYELDQIDVEPLEQRLRHRIRDVQWLGERNANAVRRGLKSAARSMRILRT